MKTGLFALVVSLIAALAAAGQQPAAGSADPASAATSGVPSPGWNLTPSILVSRTFDDNVLLR